ncbi:MAG: PilW family protein [Gammaproteobacteria bacterium]|nr:MAG: PilW family protein [Gammaproteobacteria bacterium]
MKINPRKVKPATSCNGARQRGLTLIEVMIALTIGLFLMVGTITMFISNKRTYTEQDQMSRLQENARFAMALIISDLRISGHVGCIGDTNAINDTVGVAGTGITAAKDNFVEGLEGSDAIPQKFKPSNSAKPADIVTGTDALITRYTQEINLPVYAPYMTNTTSDISINQNPPAVTPNSLQIGAIIAISDCTTTDIFKITGADHPSTNGIIEHAALSKAYGNDMARILRFFTRSYYIGNRDANSATADCDSDGVMDNADADVCPALFRNGESLADWIEDMQILYGEDTSGDKVPNTFVTASTVANWNNVIAIRIGILARSPDEYGPDTDTNTYNLFTGAKGCVVGADIGCVNPADLRVRRRVMTNTVVLRNQIYGL